MKKLKQYLVTARLKEYMVTIAFLTTAATAKEACEKTQAHIDGDEELGSGWAKVKRRCRIATERDKKIFEPDSKSIIR